MRRLAKCSLVAAVAALIPVRVSAQVTPAAAYVPPDDTPSIRVGVTFYGDYTYTESPEAKDADGNTFNPSQFNVGRSYINITGNISHLVAFRLTPDITRAGADSGAVLNGNLVFRIKYAFAQFNLGDWMTRGSWARFGIQQTPWVDFEENIYRYRFQGTVFSEREGYLSSSDAGASFLYNLPSNYGDIHVGIYNGETYPRAEVNDQKAIQIRATVRPFATKAPALRGLRAHVFYDGDRYLKDAERNRFIASVTFEHAYLNAGFDYLDTKDQDVSEAWNRRDRRQGLFDLGNAEAVPHGMGSAAAVQSSQAQWGVRFASAEPHDRRRVVLVPPPGQRCDGAAARLRRSDVRQLHTGPAVTEEDRCARAAQLLDKAPHDRIADAALAVFEVAGHVILELNSDSAQSSKGHIRSLPWPSAATKRCSTPCSRAR